MTVVLYISTVSSNLEIKKKQQKITMVLDGKKIPYQTVDIASDTTGKDAMRSKSGNPTALPPQIFNDDTYCGDYSAFEEAIESETLNEFLKL